MADKPTRSLLKKDFFAGNISLNEFQTLLKDTLRYRGLYMIPGRRPRWSGPFRYTQKEAEQDNAPYFDQGYQVDIYVEQS